MCVRAIRFVRSVRSVRDMRRIITPDGGICDIIFLKFDIDHALLNKKNLTVDRFLAIKA